MAAQNGATADESSETDNVFDADATIVIDPDDLVDAIASNGEFPDRNGRMVVTVRPPFSGECRAETRFHQAGNYWPSDADPTPVDLSPDVFHDAEFGYPERWQIAEAAAEVAGVENGYDAPEEVWDECRDVQIEVWESDVRGTLKDEIDIASLYSDSVENVAVRYETTN